MGKHTPIKTKKTLHSSPRRKIVGEAFVWRYPELAAAAVVLFHVFGLDAGEAEHLQDAVGQGLFGVALTQVEVEAEFLHDGYLVCFDELDKVAVRILDVGEVSARITHGE